MEMCSELLGGRYNSWLIAFSLKHISMYTEMSELISGLIRRDSTRYIVFHALLRHLSIISMLQPLSMSKKHLFHLYRETRWKCNSRYNFPLVSVLTDLENKNNA